MRTEQGGSSYFSPEEQVAEKNWHLDLQEMYSKEIGEYPRLSQEDTIMLAKIMHRGVLAEGILERGNGNLSHEDHVLLEQEKQEGKEAQFTIVLGNLPLVIKAVNLIYSAVAEKMPFMDCIAEGNRAFLEEVKKFDPDKGKLSTYIIPRLVRAIGRASIDTETTIRIPIWLAEKLQEFRRKSVKFAKYNGHYPNDEELAPLVNLSVDRIKEFKMLAAITAESVSSIVYRQGYDSNHDNDAFDDDFLDSVVVSDQDHETKRIVESQTLRDIMVEDLNAHLAELSEIMQRVIRLRYGLDDGGKELKFTKIAHCLGISDFKAKEIHDRAFDFLQKQMES